MTNQHYLKLTSENKWMHSSNDSDWRDVEDDHPVEVKIEHGINDFTLNILNESGCTFEQLTLKGKVSGYRDFGRVESGQKVCHHWHVKNLTKSWAWTIEGKYENGSPLPSMARRVSRRDRKFPDPTFKLTRKG